MWSFPWTTTCPASLWASLVALMVKNLPVIQETWVQSLCWEVPLKEGMAPHSSILAWRIPWTEEPGRLQSMGSQRAGHDWATNTHTHTHTHTHRCSAIIQGNLLPKEEKNKFWDTIKCLSYSIQTEFQAEVAPWWVYIWCDIILKAMFSGVDLGTSNDSQKVCKQFLSWHTSRLTLKWEGQVKELL